MDRNVVLGIVNLGSRWVSFKDFKSGKYNSTRRRSNGGEDTVGAVSYVYRCSGNRFVVFEVL